MSEPAPLIAIPAAPVPPGAEAAWIAGAGGVRLRAALFRPAGRARGSIVLSGGRTEAIEKYFEVVRDFLDRGFVVLAHDWRGQGLSQRPLADPLKGHAEGAKAFLDDFRILLDAYASRLPRPWAAVGHSMGGCLTLLAMIRGEDRFAGAILSAPMLGVQTGGRSPGAVRALVRLSRLLGRGRRYVMNDPGKPFDDAFDSNVLTHDRRRYERACALLKAEPKLALGAPTWGWLDFALKATAEIGRPERLRGVTVPVIILSAAEDRLVDNAAQAAAARHLPQGKLITVPGAYHEILMESDPMRNIFMRAFDALTGRVAPAPAEPPKAAEPAAPRPAPTEPAAAAAAVAPAETLAPSPVAAKPAAKARATRRAAGKAPVRKPAAARKAAGGKAAAAKPASARKATGKAAAKKAPAVKKAAAKPATAKKAPAARKPAAPKASAKTAAARKPAGKPAAAKTPAAKATSAKRKAPAKKPAAKKTAAKKPAPRA